jgi:hypothetical protein
MIRRTGVWVGAGVLGLLSAVGVQGCSAEGDNATDESDARALGDVSLGLVLPDGSEVSNVNYVVTRNGTEVRSGVMQVGADGRASVTISGLEPGAGYHVVLNAPRDAGLPCAGEADFSVSSSATTNVNVVLQCDDLSADTTVTVNGTFNICPKVTSTTASPTTVAVGSSASLSALARDRDNDAISFAWSAASGTFSTPNAATTSYTCASVGTQVLTISVSDGPIRNCTRSATVSISCVAGTLDAGTPDSGSDAGNADAGNADAGVTSSQTPYVIPTLTPGVITKAILTVGDSANLKPNSTVPYQMVGIPDGLGAFDNNDGTFTLLSNHELTAAVGGVRAHGAKGAFVSKWIIRKSDLRVLSGSDLIQTVQLYTPATNSYAPGTYAFGRFCSADLAEKSAWYDAATATGFDGRLFLDGEEGDPGRAWAHGLDGTSWELARLGKQAWENVVASPASGIKTVVVGTDDTTPGQVYVYVGTKTNTGSPIDKAGLTNGTLYGVKVPGVLAEVDAAPIPSGPFTLASLGDVSALSLAQLETLATTNQVTTFLRPEDGSWDPSKPNDYYFVTTASSTTNSRLWRLRFTDVKQPELGGTIEALLDGSEGHRMLDNMTIDTRGHVIAQEDVGNNARIGKLWRYTIATDSLVEIAAHDPSRFVTGAPGFLTQDEESSGVIDASSLLGNGWYLLDSQAHYAQPGELVEGGQFLALFDPGSL